MSDAAKKQANRLLNRLMKIKRSLLPGFKLDRIGFLKHIVDGFIDKSRLPYVDNIHGHKMYLDQQDSLRLSFYGSYENFETDYFQRHIEPGHTVLDIGGNIGYYTLIFARCVGQSGHVYAFEPEPGNFDLLSRNVGLNGYTANTTLVNAAVSDSGTPLTLYLSEENKGDHRTYDSGDGRKAVQVDSLRLDDYFDGRDITIDYIKMDIQGAEYHAVLGMRSLLERNPGVRIISEFWPIGLQRQGIEPRAYLELLQSLGFRVHHIDEARETIEAADFDALLREFTPENGLHTNVLCFREPADS